MDETAFLQSRACTGSKLLPHAHLLGNPSICLLYLIAMASRNFSLFKTYPSSARGKTLSQFEAPLALAFDIVLVISGVKCWFKLVDMASTLVIRSRFSFLVVFMSISSSGSANIFWVTINAASGALNVFDALYSKSASVVKIIPNPPRRVGRANISRSSKETSNPKICGRRSDVVIISSIGLSRWAIFGIVRT